MSRRGRALSIVALLTTVLALAGCSSKHHTFSDDGTTSIIDPSSPFSATTLRDWKDLGDAIVAVDVTADRKDPGTIAHPAGQNGVYGRLIDVTVVHVYWQRGPAFAPPSSFTSKAWGWVDHGNELQPIVARGEPRLEPHHLYLMAIAKFSTGWAGLGAGAEVPFDGGVIGTGEWQGRDKNIDQPAIDSLLGKNAAGVQTSVDETQPDPRAAQFDNLSPAQRAKKLGVAK
jgi:hypothetical protein